MMDKRQVANLEVKRKLVDALVDLVIEKDFFDIKVTDLINRSGVARASFYRNFNSIEELIEYGVLQLYIEYNEHSILGIETFENKEHLVYKFNFFKKHKKYILAYHRGRLPKTLLGILNNHVENKDSNPDTPTSYETYYHYGAFYNIVIAWLESGAKESPLEMTEIFLAIRYKKD